MMLLNAVTGNTTGTGFRMTSPCTVYVDGTIGGGNVSIQIAREITPATDQAAATVGPYVQIENLTAVGRVNIFTMGVYWLRAVLAGSTSPTITVATG